MGWFKREVKAFGREFARQGSILLFGKAPKPKLKLKHPPKKKTGAQLQYERAQRWVKRHGFR